MRYLKFFLSLALTLGLLWLLGVSDPLGMSPLPPMGKLLNPYHGFWQNAEPSGAKPSESLDLAGLSAPVKVVYDTRMVPHVFAANLSDALRAQGYLTAKFRLWQMDIAARSGAGRLSEVLGERTLEVDRFNRRRGLARGAEASLRGWGQAPDTMALLQAYTDGINDYIYSLQPKDYPIEFKILNYQPEPWTPLKTALVLKLNAAVLCFREDDIEATNSLAWLGEEMFRSLYPERPHRESVIVPDSCFFQESFSAPPSSPAAADESLGFWHTPTFPKPPRDIGSNNWAVNGSKTSSGNPILANDPHLNLSLPSLWMEIQLHTPDMNVYGVTVPGIPGVILGFNDYVAWGWTNAGHDVLDWHEVDWTGPDKMFYRFDNQPMPAVKEVETILVRGKKAFTDTLTYTHWGPIVYEDAKHPKRNLAMRWAAIEEPKSSELGFMLGVNAARNYDDIQRASRGFHFPGQNIVFASKSGDIALTVTGRYPIKKHEQGRFVQKGSESAHFWNEYIPFDHLPRTINPARGFVASANQLSAGPSYPYYYNGVFNTFRGRQVDRKLAERNNFTVFSMMELQTNNYSILAEEALPAMLSYLDKDQFAPLEMGMAQLLGMWNYEFNAGEVAPIIFQEWWIALDSLLWDEMYAKRDTLAVLMPEKWRTVQALQEEPMNVFWDIRATEERESPSQTVTLAFKRAISHLGDKLQQDDYNWGQHHAVSIKHLAQIEPFSAMNLTPGGHPEAINAIRAGNGPSWRMVVEMGPEIKAYGVYPGGQSGNPGSPYYDNFVATWAKGAYFPLFFMQTPEDRQQEILFEQQLTPAGKR